MIYQLRKPDRRIVGDIHLDGSKSISNRALIIRALCGCHFDIHHLSTSRDTLTLQALLASDDPVLDAGAAGTTFRFMTALLAARPGSQILTGTERMKQRPVGVLVEALRQLGARIDYLERAGYPPLHIHSPEALGTRNPVLSVPAGTSSQYLSALLMIAPVLPAGMELHLEGNLVSRPYLEMTLRMMEYFGISYTWDGPLISIPSQTYQPREFTVEADWSAASYYYAMAALSESCELRLHGLFKDSLQGDSVLPEMMQYFGVRTTFTGENQVLLTREEPAKPYFEWDFLPCPDLAQTVSVLCAGLGVHGLFTGLETLRIKETDRISALQQELAKVQVYLSMLPARFAKKSNRELFHQEGTAVLSEQLVFDTYEDHRMAMSLAALAMLGTVGIREPGVVSKSYPAFWTDLQSLGFELREF
jgi:3-phosphoshikimate 1-carboxyvinyltransferase